MVSEVKDLTLAAIHEILPTEIFVMILKKLGSKSIWNAKLTCREWKKVIDDFRIMKSAIGKFESFKTLLFLSHTKSLSEKVSAIILVGGLAQNNIPNDQYVEIINDWPRRIRNSKTIEVVWRPSLVQLNDSILLCGGFNNNRMCLIIEKGCLKVHSTLNRNRVRATAVATNSATFIFGGIHEEFSYEYLPKDTTTWIHGKDEIPGGIADACAIATKSGQEIFLFGSHDSENDQRILKFNVKDHTFERLPAKLTYGRCGARCDFIPGTNKVIITGGFSLRNFSMSSNEIFDTEDGSITMAVHPMNLRRSHHGIGIVTINDEDKLTVFGGISCDGGLERIETLNSKTQKWEMTDIKLSQKRYEFGYLSVKNLRCFK